MSTRTRSERALVVAWLLASRLVLADDASAPQPQEDPTISAYRERFNKGLDRYKAGDVAQSIQYWEPLYRDLGPERGYRVAYDLARAYERFGDVTRAAERFEVFVAESDAREARGDAVEPLVAREASDAKARLAAMKRSRARIAVAASTPPSSVTIDATEPRLAGFVAYVAPGAHTVVFDAGSANEQRRPVSVAAGEVLVVSREADSPPAAPVQATARTAPPPRPERTHALSPLWAVAAGGATLASSLLPYLAYAHASTLRARYSPPHAATPAEQADYAGARSQAYASWAIPGVLALTTAALTTVYFATARTRLVPVVGADHAGLWCTGTF